MTPRVFQNREEAGCLLGERLAKFADRDDVIVLALPRGGVPVGCEIAKRLHAPLDVVVVRKLGFPGQEEFAMGAIASGGVLVLNEEALRWKSVTAEAMADVTARETAELLRREAAYRNGHPGLAIAGRTVLLVDDGVATGSTMRAAARAIRAAHPAHLVIAVPTAPPEFPQEFQDEVDEIIALQTPATFRAVGQWYMDFAQTSDAEVLRCLEEVRAMQADSPISPRTQ